MKKPLVNIALSAGTAWLFFVGVAFAGDGSTGTTSEGSTYMQIDIPALVKISGVADLWPANGASEFTGGASDLDKSDGLCIFSNMNTGNNNSDYIVTATGNGGASSDEFKLTCQSADCGSETIAYEVRWTGSEGSESQITTSGTAHGTKFKSWSPTETCASDNATVRVTIPRANLIAVHYGQYTGTLKLLITPDPS